MICVISFIIANRLAGIGMVLGAVGFICHIISFW
jgi:preprotein translocase subunit Sss1